MASEVAAVTPAYVTCTTAEAATSAEMENIPALTAMVHMPTPDAVFGLPQLPLLVAPPAVMVTVTDKPDALTWGLPLASVSR